MNKKGFSTVILFQYAFLVFLFAVFFGIAVWGFTLVDDAFDQDVDIGAVNLREVNDDTYGAMAQALLDRADTLALAVVFGMIMFMFVSALFFGSSNKMWIPVDIIILIFVFILAVYLSSIYEILINSSSLIDVYIDDLPKTSRFLLNLPSIIATLGALLMIITYTRIGKDQEEASPVAGF